jgi:APA family basic amino acid/polyamine antiporter
MSFITRRRAVDQRPATQGAHSLRATLRWPHLMALGVGAIVGTGIYTLTGVGAGLAGPGVILSFAIAGGVCTLAALCYAEMATLMPHAGSAYSYSYAGMGEMVAWIIGWSLILEYTVVCSAVAVGWSGYAQGFLAARGMDLPPALAAGLLAGQAGGLVNLPAVLITLAVAGMLLVGLRESANLNLGLVVLKIAALAAFVALALPAFDPERFTPFLPFGFSGQVGPDGAPRGVMAAAALIFFAFYGFDAISTAAEEAENPGRDLTLGIIGSMAACAVIYMAVAAVAVGASPWQVFSESSEPLAFILRSGGHDLAAVLIAAVAVVARDGLLPRTLAQVSPRGAPVRVTVFTGLLAAVIAGAAPLKLIAELANAGTLAAFVATAVSMMILRVQRPDLPRPFRTPLWWIVGPLAIAGCLYLFWSLPALTRWLFLGWNLVGLAVYLLWSRRHSVLAGS